MRRKDDHDRPRSQAGRLKEALETRSWGGPDHLAPGSVIVFDELVGYPEFREHEMRALWEENERGLRWDWLCAVNAAVAVRVR